MAAAAPKAKPVNQKNLNSNRSNGKKAKQDPGTSASAQGKALGRSNRGGRPVSNKASRDWQGQLVMMGKGLAKTIHNETATGDSVTIKGVEYLVVRKGSYKGTTRLLEKNPVTNEHRRNAAAVKAMHKVANSAAA
jgi:hypothetical protein